MRKAVKRVALAEKWKSEHPEEAIDDRLLSLGYHWNQVMEEMEQKEQTRAKTQNHTCGFESVP
jgi:hypothetical protein